MESKEQTPITADKYFDNINWNMLLNLCENPLDELKKRAEFYAKAKVLEALERFIDWCDTEEKNYKSKEELIEDFLKHK